MKITHVARGEEWLASVPKHILLYRYFGWQEPVFMHLSLMRNADKSKLSKRKNPTSISYYSALGYLPEALMNFLGLFFIQIAEGEELLSMDELAASSTRKHSPRRARSSTSRSSTAERSLAARKAFAGRVHCPHAGMGDGKPAPDGRPEALPEPRLQARRIAQSRRLPALRRCRPDTGLLRRAEEQAGEILEILTTVATDLEKMPDWNVEAIEAELRDVAERTGKKLRVVTPPLFVAMSGSSRSLPLFDSMALLGRSVVRQRLKAAIAVVTTMVGAAG